MVRGRGNSGWLWRLIVGVDQRSGAMADRSRREIGAEALLKQCGHAARMGGMMVEMLHETTGASVRSQAALPQSRRSVWSAQNRSVHAALPEMGGARIGAVRWRMKATRTGDAALAGYQAVVPTTPGQRRQRLSRGTVPHGEVPPGVCARGLRRSGCRAQLGSMPANARFAADFGRSVGERPIRPVRAEYLTARGWIASIAN